MSRTFLIFAREYLENVRTKAFLIGLVLTPVWMGLMFLVPTLGRDSTRSERLLLVDDTGELAGPLAGQLAPLRAGDGSPRFRIEALDPQEALDPAALQRRAGQGEAFVLRLTRSLLENKRRPAQGEPAPVLYGPSGVGALEAGRLLEQAVHAVVNGWIVRHSQVDPAVAVALTTPTVRYTSLTEEGNEGGPAQALAPFLTMLMLYMGVVGISQMLISSTIEEKASRVYEVLLSSVSPLQLMAGKMLAICAVGLTLMLAWSGGGLLTASVQGMGGVVSGTQAGLFLAYYLLGFVMIASLMVMVGSACSTLKEAQNLMSPISMVLALPLLLSFLVMRDPHGSAATALSFVPLFTPFLMMARIASVPGPPPEQVVASLLLLVACTVLAVRMAGRVFRVGILMVGQPATLKQIWRWMRTP